MKVLVTGAGGDIGSRLVSALLQQGHTIRALARTSKEADRIRRPGVEIFLADVTDPTTLDGAALDVQATFHLAAALFVTNPEEDLRLINYEGTINVANECIEKGVKRFIFPSFPLVLGPHTAPSPPVSPEAAPGQPNTYHALYKKLCEQHLLIMNEQGKLDVTILRLGTVYGPTMRLIKILSSFMSRGLYRIPGNGNNLFHAVHVEDVAQAMLLALTSEQAKGQIYNVADDLPVRFKEFVFAFADILGVKRPGFAPLWLFRTLASAATVWATITGSPPLINNDIVTFNISSFAADTSKTKEELGFMPKYPTIYDGLKTCITPPEPERSAAA